MRKGSLLAALWIEHPVHVVTLNAAMLGATLYGLGAAPADRH